MTPVPFEVRFRFMFPSLPLLPTLTVAGFAVAAFVTVTESTAEAVALDVKKGLPFASWIAVAFRLVIVGDVERTTVLPEPVVAAATNWLDTFDARAAAEAGTAAPFTLITLRAVDPTPAVVASPPVN